MIEATKKMYQNYFNYHGRTSRRDFWLAILAYFIIVLAIPVVGGIITNVAGVNPRIWVYLILAYTLLSVFPIFTMQIRRLHDINKSGWWLLIDLIPTIGFIILLVFYTSKSVDENNNY